MVEHHQPLEHCNKPALVPAFSVISTSLSGRLHIACADRSYGFSSRTNKKDNRVFSKFSQLEDGEYSTIQLPGQLSPSRCFVGRLLEKALLVLLKSQLDDCGDLNVAVGGSNWDLLRGKVKRIEVSAKKAVYKGIVLSEVGLAASNVRAKLGKNRLFQQPFIVHANIRVREQDFNTSLTSSILSSSLNDILPRYSQAIQVQYDNGNLRFSSSDKQSGRYGELKYPITVRVDVEESGEVISIEASQSASSKMTFKVGPEVKITDFQVGSSWLLLTGEFLVTPW